MSIVEILRTVSWQPAVGDPTLSGWITVAMYLLAATCCAACAWQSERIFPGRSPGAHRLLWAGLAILLLFLAVNKQLDLHTLFTNVVKAIAWEQGWYRHGQQAQRIFILGFAGTTLLLLLLGGWILRRFWRQYWLILLGGLFLARFFVVRAATFYGVSLPEVSRITGGVRVNGMLEVAGALVISLTAMANLLGASRRRLRAPIQ